MITSQPASQVSSKDVSRQNSTACPTRRKSSIENVVVCKELPTKHAHVALSHPGFTPPELQANEIEWMKAVDVQVPAILFSSQEAPVSKPLQADLWTAKQYKLTPGAKVLVRVFESKIYGDADQHYQLVVKAGKNSCKSCLSPKSGSIEDWFLLGLDENMEISSGSIEILMETIPDQQYKQQKQSGFKHLASEFMSVLSKGGLRKDAFDHGNLPQTGICRLSLAALLNTGLSNKPAMEIGGKYLLKTFSNQKMGEISLHIAPTPGAIKIHEDTGKQQGGEMILHQAYINYESYGEWKRFWGVLTRETLMLKDPKNRRSTETSPCIALNDLVKLNLVSGDGNLNEIGMENCVEMAFEDSSVLFMYADNEPSAKLWADAICQTVWGQPYDLKD